jgi:serine-type D-Ala-D-Ala endopeptidase (penicillin-binding protein 7)
MGDDDDGEPMTFQPQPPPPAMKRSSRAGGVFHKASIGERLEDAPGSRRARALAAAVASCVIALAVLFSSSALAADARTEKRHPTPRIRASSAVVLDSADGKLLFAKNEKELRPIASITKLMTALVFIETGESLRTVVTIEPADREDASRTIFRAGEEVIAHDLLFAALLNSDNVAARGLVKASGLTSQEFVAQMNRKARLLGLPDTHFEDPTGLDPRNVSTALDCAALVGSAARDPFLRTILMTREYSFRTERRLHTIHSTNRLLLATDKIVVGKTGFINEAGYCFASCFDSAGRDLAVVVLGARSPSARFREANDLIKWVLSDADSR